MRVARLAGIPVRLHWSFLLLVVLGLVATAVTSGAVAAGMSLVLGVALFGSVVLHELGHALVARVYGIDTAHITLYPFGGVAAIARMPSSPSQELAIAAAGPAVNFALFAVFLGGWAASGVELVGLVAAVNLVMGLFNLLPAFPMDGGRILRAALARPLGYVRSSRVALVLGRVFAWGFVIGGVATWHPSLLLVGLFLHYAVTIERRRLEAQVAEAEWAAIVSARRRPVYVPRWRITPLLP